MAEKQALPQQERVEQLHHLTKTDPDPRVRMPLPPVPLPSGEPYYCRSCFFLLHDGECWLWR